MKLIVVAVGTRMPKWVDEAFEEYAKRMPRGLRIELVEVRPEPRSGGKSTAQLLEAEAARIEHAVPRGSFRTALDERGREFSTAELARWVDARRLEGRDAAFLIGGPDGLALAAKSNAELVLRLSAMTLPHGLARVLLAEQLYRAASILDHLPYHRE
ncbi:MAG TPA: 23S rRNA (pseudouridine(1915)-N(3))-methyltransferase RlmH [Burkholderiales bacterium]|nr:23S rRNA (pseudouridine(1915)-N(3))-methyltransferase RlmH [Burkholderiales bacterium]